MLEQRMQTVQRRDSIFVHFTPKAELLNQLRAEGKSFDEALAIADREFTADGLIARRGTADIEAVLSGGIAQMGEVQF